MIQEDKKLLFKDLCARLPYGVKFPMMCWDEEKGEVIKSVILYSINKDGYCHVSEEDYSPYIDEIKPYLFPMSSMTDEQYNEFFAFFHDVEMKEIETSGDYLKAAYLGENAKCDWLNKNHFDYRYLIEKGLALDATGLNIY